MPWSGSGTFNRIYSWVADKAAGLDISSSRMDTDTDDIASNGFGNCLTRDGQGQPTADLPMAGFRHIGVQNAVSRTDYAAFGQVQDGLPNWTVAAGTPDALTAIYTPALTTLNDGQLCFLRAGAPNATTTPTFSPSGLPPEVITRFGGQALGIGDIAGASAEIILRYNLSNTRWELMNPSNIALNNGIAVTGMVSFTLASSPPPGWLIFDDGTFGSAASGSSNSNSAANQTLFNILFASPFTDTTCPLLTSTGATTTRAGQGSAAAAWAANCRMSLPKTLGRALAVAGSGAGLSSFTMGQVTGENTHTLNLSETPAGITSSGSNSITVTPNAGTNVPSSTAALSAVFLNSSGSVLPEVPTANGNFISTSSFSGTNTINVTSNNTGGGAHNNMPPEAFMNAIVKQ